MGVNWITAEAAAQATGKSRRTIYSWCRAGWVDWRREGRAIMVDAATLPRAEKLAREAKSVAAKAREARSHDATA